MQTVRSLQTTRQQGCRLVQQRCRILLLPASLLVFLHLQQRQLLLLYSSTCASGLQAWSSTVLLGLSRVLSQLPVFIPFLYIGLLLPRYSNSGSFCCRLQLVGIAPALVKTCSCRSPTRGGLFADRSCTMVMQCCAALGIATVAASAVACKLDCASSPQPCLSIMHVCRPLLHIRLLLPLMQQRYRPAGACRQADRNVSGAWWAADGTSYA